MFNDLIVVQQLIDVGAEQGNDVMHKYLILWTEHGLRTAGGSYK